MRSRISIGRTAVIGAVSVLVILVAAVFYDQSKSDQIAEGISLSGIDVGGMNRAAAQETLRSSIETSLLKPVVVRFGGKTHRLTAAGAGVEVDINGMVQSAIDASRSSIFPIRVVRLLAGADVNKSLATQVTYSQQAINNFTRKVAANHDRKAKNAEVKFSGSGLGEVDGRTGVKVKRAELKADIVAAFSDPDADHSLRAEVKRWQPTVRRKQLSRKYPIVITVDREHFRLRLFKKLKLSKTYKIAVGQVGLETPAGLYRIADKQIDPAWHVPNSAWAGSLAGKVIPGGAPNNPIRARWLGIFDGVGIHGTTASNSIGSAASHGCIRMLISDVKDLYDRVPVGAPVYIG